MLRLPETTDSVAAEACLDSLRPRFPRLIPSNVEGGAVPVSAWLTGKRRPNANGLMAIDRVYHVSPRVLDRSPVDFAQLLAYPSG